MIAGIHQPHYFPWMGYFNKMAKSDVFILLDEVQMEKGSYMYRNRILNERGKVEYLTISGDKHGYLEKKYNEILSTNDDVWLKKQSNTIRNAYNESPFFDEIWSGLSFLFDTTETTICSYCLRSIKYLKTILNIDTELVLQSELELDKSKKKNDLVLELCQIVGADKYLSGNGAKKYTDEASFYEAGIRIEYQNFNMPIYNQVHSKEFVPGLSMLDLLFNLGLDETNRVFWSEVESGREFI